MTNLSLEQFREEPASEVYVPKKVIYTGLFIPETDKETLLTQVPPKFEKIFAHHLTLMFRPDDGIQSIELGRVTKLKLIGQVIDEEIGIQACLVETDPEVSTSNKNPHITISAREGVAPVKSNDAISKALENGNVIKFDKAIEIDVTEGFFDGASVITAIPPKS